MEVVCGGGALILLCLPEGNRTDIYVDQFCSSWKNKL